MKSLQITRLAVAAALVFAGSAQAASFVGAAPTFTPTTELVTFDSYDGLMYEAAAYPLGLYLDNDGDVLLTTGDGGALIGAFVQDLEDNGGWGARFEPTPTGSGNFLAATQTLNFNFGADGPQARVGAFFNISNAFGGDKGNQITLTALNEANEVLETVSFSVNTSFESYNEGVFAGFARTTADIANLRVSFTGGASLVMDELHLSAAPVPEPTTLALMAGGLGLLASLRRRSR